MASKRAQRPLRLQQVELAKADHRAQLRPQPHQAFAGAAAAQEVAAPQAGVELGYRIDRVHAAACALEHGGIDVGGQDRHRRHGQRCEGVARGHRDAVGLLPGRCGAAPDLQRGLRSATLQVPRQQRKVVRRAEEGGQVGGQRVDELLPLGLGIAVPFQRVQVGAEVRLAQLAQPP